MCDEESVEQKSLRSVEQESGIGRRDSGSERSENGWRESGGHESGSEALRVVHEVRDDYMFRKYGVY